MIRQKHTQDIMASVVQESLTCQGKSAMIHLSGCGIQMASKKGRLSRTPALHLLPTHAVESCRLTLSSSSSSFSSSSSIPDHGRAPAELSEREKEAENLPPRRPLKLAPLELPLEVREAHKLKCAQEVSAAGCKSAETYPRKAKVCWQDGPGKSPERFPLSTITAPHKPLPPVNQAKLGSDRSAGKEAGQGEGNPSVRLAHAPDNIYQSKHGNSQSAAPAKSPDAVKRRLRLRRTQRLEEDQSKSSSSAGGLSADEGKQASAGPGKGQRVTEKAFRDANRVLQKASWRNLREPGVCENEAVGKFGRRMAVNDIQEAVF